MVKLPDVAQQDDLVVFRLERVEKRLKCTRRVSKPTGPITRPNVQVGDGRDSHGSLLRLQGITG